MQKIYGTHIVRDFSTLTTFYKCHIEHFWSISIAYCACVCDKIFFSYSFKNQVLSDYQTTIPLNKIKFTQSYICWKYHTTTSFQLVYRKQEMSTAQITSGMFTQPQQPTNMCNLGNHGSNSIYRNTVLLVTIINVMTKKYW